MYLIRPGAEIILRFSSQFSRNSLKLFRSLSRDCHTSKSKHESRYLRITTRDYIVCYEHRNCNRFLISCGEVFQWSQSSSMLRRQFPADVGVTNRQLSSNSELIFCMEMRLLACLTRGPSREPYQTY